MLMARSRKVTLVDGYTALKAAQHAEASAPKLRSSAQPGGKAKSTPVSNEPENRKTPASHIGHTAMPTKRHVICYSCDYDFSVTGRMPSTLCPKCKTELDLSDHVLEGEYSGDLRTAGIIRLAPGSVLIGGSLYAQDIILQGRMKGGRIEAYRALELAEGARLLEAHYAARDLRVAAGVSYTLKKVSRFHCVEIRGHLKARLEASGRVALLAGGLFEGQLRAAHLTVEEGAGLSADLHIDAIAVEQELQLAAV